MQSSTLLVVQLFMVLHVYAETEGFTLKELQKKVVATGWRPENVLSRGSGVPSFKC